MSTARAITGSTLVSRRELEFLLFEWLGTAELLDRPRYAHHSVADLHSMLDVCAQIATEKFADHNKRNDREEPVFDGSDVHVHDGVKPGIDAFTEVGMPAATADRSVGGLQIPTVVANGCMTWFYAANVATTTYLLLASGVANLLFAHGSNEQIDRFARPITTGRYLGTMCLSEPQAGSSLSDISTRARAQPDGSWRVTGTKMWIGAADHDLTENIIHLVLAKIDGGPVGTKGISLFIVPKFVVDDDGRRGERNDVAVAGLNHKMGYRGTVNAALNFGDGSHLPGGRAGAVGYLVGSPGDGLRQMFHMMNEARTGVGISASAIGSAGYLRALAYARVRTQGRSPVDKDPTAPQIPIIGHADVRRMLLACKSYVEGGLALGLYCSRLVDDQLTAPTTPERDDARLLLDVLTPIAKSWPSQWCLTANDLAIQIHGGYGYTRDYDVEQLYRDNRVNSIHEGAHGIHGLDLLGRKVTMSGGAGLHLLTSRIGATITRASTAGPELAVAATELNGHVERLVAATATIWAGDDIEASLANATVYLEATGHIVIAWLWLDQLVSMQTCNGDFYDGKRQAGRYFIEWELPKVGPMLDILQRIDRTALDMRPEWF